MPKFGTAKGSAPLHAFVGIGVAGTVSTRRASCHQCKSCLNPDGGLDWKPNYHNCENLGYTGSLGEMSIPRAADISTSLSRVTKAQLESKALERAGTAEVGSTICFETPDAEKTHPWVLGKVLEGLHDAPAGWSPPAHFPIRLHDVRESEPALKVQLWEPIELASKLHVMAQVEVMVPAKRVRVVGIGFEDKQRRARGVEPSSKRFKISEESLSEIR